MLQMAKPLTILCPAEKHQGVAYVSIFLSMCLCLATGAFLWERIALFSGQGASFFSAGEFYATFVATLLSLVLFFVVLRRNFRIPVSRGWLFFFLVLGVGNAIGTFAFGSHFSGTIVYREAVYSYDWTFTFGDRVQYVLCFFVGCVYFYLFYAVLPKVLPHVRWIRLVGWIAVVVAVLAIFYSLVAEWNGYAALFTPERRVGLSRMSSFTNNPNTFGFILLLAVACLCSLHNANSRLFYWLLILFFGAFQFLVLSSTSIICTWFLIVAYGLYRYVVSVRRRPVRSTILLLLCIGAIIAGVVLVFSDAFGSGMLFAKIHAEIKYIFDGNVETFTTRVETWNQILDALANPIQLLFGLGDFQSRLYCSLLHVPLANGIMAYPAHNGWLQALADGGLLRLCFYLFLTIRFLYVCISRIGSKSRTSWPILLAFLAMLLHGVMESTGFLNMDTKGFALLLFLILPSEIEHYQARHPHIKRYVDAYKVNAIKPTVLCSMSPKRFATVALLIITPLAVIGFGVGLFGLVHPEQCLIFDWSYFGLWLLVSLLAPFSLFCLGTCKWRRVLGVLFGLSLITAIEIGIGFMAIDAIYSRVAFFLVLALCLLPALRHPVTNARAVLSLLMRAYLPYLFIGGCLFGVFVLPVLLSNSIHTLVMCGMSIVLVYVILMIWLRLLRLAYPLDERFRLFNIYATGLSVVREEKREAKQQRKYGPKPVPSRPKRIYTYRL